MEWLDVFTEKSRDKRWKITVKSFKKYGIVIEKSLVNPLKYHRLVIKKSQINHIKIMD